MSCRWFLAFGAGALASGLLALPAAGQQATTPPAQTAEAEQAPEDVDVSKIDQILRGDQEVLQGEFFSYDPAGRRDPFRSLLEGFEEEEKGENARPPGLPGMLIEELQLEGIIQTEGGILAFVQGRDNLSYVLRPGTKLYNGEVDRILPNKVVFKQQVNDPKQLKPYEEVVREIAD